MATKNSIIYTAADYNISISASTPAGAKATSPLSVVESLDYGAKLEHEYIYSLGSKEPQGLKTNGFSYSGKVSMELGEAEIFLVKLGIQDMAHIENGTISVITKDGKVKKVYENIVCTSYDGSVKSKDKRSIVTFNFESTGNDIDQPSTIS